MFEDLRSQLKEQGETVQVAVQSDKLVPSIEMIGDKRVLFLDYEGHRYPCLEKGWVSWASKILVPTMEERRARDLVDNETGRNRRWSTGTIRKFLEMTPTAMANTVVRSWWERHQPTDWHVVKYADNGHLGPIRFIGTARYQLYKHHEFLNDLSETDFTGMCIRNQSLTENHMVLRVTDIEELPIEGTNVFSGFHLLNSENGSSSIIVKHMIYDEICTNGMIVVFKDNTVISQRHSRFDMDMFREKVTQASKELPEVHEKAKDLVVDLTGIKLKPEEIDASFSLYEDKYEASKRFADTARTRTPRYGLNAWGVVSAITEVAQNYGWDDRMEHEVNAGLLVDDLKQGRYKEYITAEAT